MKASIDRPLKDSEIEKLGNLLLNLNDGNAMTIEELDGFFCALFCGPDLVLPSEYLYYVFRGSNEPKFESRKEADRFFSLTVRLWNMIARALGSGEPYKVCIFDEDLDGVPSVTRWAVGFLNGMALRPESWSRLAKDKKYRDLLVPVLAFAGNDGPIPGTVPVQVPDEILEPMLFNLMGSLPRIFAYFRTAKPARKTKKKAARKRRPSSRPVARSGPLIN